MIVQLKKTLYFPIAWYFRFFASIRLLRWKPRIILVTGSNGKTTLFSLLEAQIGEKAVYSYHANSSYGIPFDILDLHRKTLQKSEWFWLFLKTPFLAFRTPPKQKIYVVEADTDRPGEGKFLGEFLKPEIVLWASVARTHGMNFDFLVKKRMFSTVEDAIAYDFGYFLEYCQKLAVVNSDSPRIVIQLDRTKAKVKSITKREYLEEYELKKNATIFYIQSKKYEFQALLPEEVFYSLCMCLETLAYLDLPFDDSFKQFVPPPGRSSLFEGIKDTMIVDSCYNANLSSMRAILTMFDKLPGKKKWGVIGDMLEQGEGEKEEHEKLAVILSKIEFERLVFLGPRVSNNTYPKLSKLIGDKIPMDTFLNPKEALQFLQDHIQGKEIILFKGARFMEGIIEGLLKDKKDVSKLSRREKIWEIRRKQWGF